MKKKLSSLLLAGCMMLGMLPTVAFADDVVDAPLDIASADQIEAPVDEAAIETVDETALKAADATGTEESASVTSENAVAVISGTYYDTLASAVNAVQNNPAEITVLKDCSDLDTITIENSKKITLNLNNKNITFKADNMFNVNGGLLDVTGTGTISSSYATSYKSTIYVVGSPTDQADYSVVKIGESVTVKNNGSYGLAIVPASNSNSAYGAKMIVNGTVESTYGFTVNGLAKQTTGNIPEIDVTKTGKMIANNAAPLYAAGYAKYNIAGTLEGRDFGIEIRAGELTVAETAKISSTADFTNPVPNGNGSTVVGAAIAVSQHTTNLPITVNINGGTISSTGTNGYAIYEIDTVTDEATENVAKDVNVTVSNGNFTGNVGSINKKITISGGTFTTDPSAYLAENYGVEKKDGKFVVGPVVESVKLDKETAEVKVGETVELKATVLPEGAVNTAVIWTSSDTGVATVTNGVVTGVAPGTADITATVGNFSAKCTVTVPKPITPSADGSGNVTVSGTDVTKTDDVTPDNNTVTIDAADASSITIAAETTDALADTTKSVAIKTDAATVEFDKTAMDVIAKAGQVVLNVAVADTTADTAAAKEVTLTLVDANSKEVLPESAAAKNGTVTVTVPDAAGKDGKAEVYYVKDKTEQWIASTVNKDNSVTFATTHFSKYLIKQTVHTCVDANSDGKCDVCGEAMLLQPNANCDGKDKCPTAKYNDLKNKDPKVWYHQAVDFVVLNEIMIGTDKENAVWGVGQTISRAEIAQIMYNMTAAEGYEAPKKATFTDVPVDEWYFKAVEWANTDGCMVGTGEGKFEPTRPVTRQEYATVMYRVVTKHMTAAEKNAFDADCNAVKLDGFTDSKQIDDFALTGMKMCVASEIIKGNDLKQLMPKKGATREEAAQMIMNFLNMEKK